LLSYREWAELALEFTKSLASLPGKTFITAELHPPISLTAVRALNDRLRIPMPEPLCEFLTQASSNCNCTYSWEPPRELQSTLERIFPNHTSLFGGPSLCDISWIEEREMGCLDTADATRELFPEGARIWANSVPFHAVGNGDYFALYTGPDRENDELPVVFLDHDNCLGTKKLGRTFDDFLSHWEDLHYLDAQFLIQTFLDPIRGALNTRSPTKVAFDEFLQTALGN
jgi:hypothetical protein